MRTRGSLERRLRLSNEIENVGAGPLELYPVNQGCADTRYYRKAMQRVYVDQDSSSRFDRASDTSFNTYEAGCTLFHH